MFRQWRAGKFTKPPVQRRRGGGGGVGVKKAYTAEDAPATRGIQCYLNKNLTGPLVLVGCEVAGDGVLSNAIPRLEKGDTIFVVKVDNLWQSVVTFQTTADCT